MYKCASGSRSHGEAQSCPPFLSSVASACGQDVERGWKTKEGALAGSTGRRENPLPPTSLFPVISGTIHTSSRPSVERTPRAFKRYKMALVMFSNGLTSGSCPEAAGHSRLEENMGKSYWVLQCLAVSSTTSLDIRFNGTIHLCIGFLRVGLASQSDCAQPLESNTCSSHSLPS